MRDDRSYHQRLQELIDCFMETDPKAELEKASKGVSGVPTGDPDELALKFLGLGIFYGATEPKISSAAKREGSQCQSEKYNYAPKAR
jgi:hypothetical protein